MAYNQFETGKRIQKLRKTKKMTQEQFAEALNISDRHMRSLEKGEYTPLSPSPKNGHKTGGKS